MIKLLLIYVGDLFGSVWFLGLKHQTSYKVYMHLLHILFDVAE